MYLQRINLVDYDDDTRANIVKLELLKDTVARMEKVIEERNLTTDKLSAQLVQGRELLAMLNGYTYDDTQSLLGENEIEKVRLVTQRIESEVQEMQYMQSDVLDELDGTLNFKTETVTFIVDGHTHGWLTKSEAGEYFHQKVEAFNKDAGKQIIDSSSDYDGARALIVMAFDPRYREPFEKFLFDTCQQVVMDYNIAMLKNDKYAHLHDAFNTTDSTEYNVQLYGASVRNFFPHLGNPRYQGESFDAVKHILYDDEQSKLLPCNKFKPHYKLSSTNRIAADVEQWYLKNNVSEVHGEKIFHDKASFDQVADITAAEMLHDNIEVKKEMEKDIKDSFMMIRRQSVTP